MTVKLEKKVVLIYAKKKTKTEITTNRIESLCATTLHVLLQVGMF